MGAVVLVFFLLAISYLNLILTVALAGSETGEFCPDCVDWSDQEGWLVKRAAYLKAQENAGSQNGIVSGNTPVPDTVFENPKDGYAAKQLLVDAASGLQGRIVLDVRSKEDYQSGHIPGARNLYWKELQKGGNLDPDLAQAALSMAGVNDSDRLIVYGGTDEGAVFVFWALGYLGSKNVSLLDGGANAAWAAKVAPDKRMPGFPRSNYTVQLAAERLVTLSNLDRFLSQADIQILDARDFSDYGRNRLTNASICLSADNFFEDSKILDAATLDDLLSRRRLDKTATQIVYGTPQAYWLFYSLKLMGYNATLLEGDWWKQTGWAVSNVK